MVINILLFIAGVALIFKGSDFFVDASIAIGKITKMPRLVIGGTLVSLATTTPELTVSIIAGINKAPGLAIGNALGSVGANIGLILALSAIIRPFIVSPGELRWRAQVVLGFAIILFLMTIDLQLPQWRGATLLGIGIIYLFLDYLRGRSRYAEQGEAIGETPDVRLKSRRSITGFFLLGAAMVVGGSTMLVNSGTAIAEAIGVPPLFVGLTMVAIGSSLPELATAIAAVRKRAFDLSVGNLIGANALNLTLVSGTAATISPLTLTRTTQLYTFPAILLILVVFFILVRTKNRLLRWEGFLLMGLYLAFIAGLTLLT
ncbi:calcium/sodium antiporter [Chloroflexota bacterium]